MINYQKGPSTYHREPVEYWRSPPGALPSLWWEAETDFGNGAIELRECTAEIVGGEQSRIGLYAFVSDRAHLLAEGWFQIGLDEAVLAAEKARERAAAGGAP